MTDFATKFNAYGGDYKATIEKFMGDESFYLQMLHMLKDDTSYARLGAALEQNDLDAAFDAAHELKGVSGNLSLTPLYTAMCAIVEPLRAGGAGLRRPVCRRGAGVPGGAGAVGMRN